MPSLLLYLLIKEFLLDLFQTLHEWLHLFLCLTNIVVNASSWQIAAFFIFSTIWMNVPSIIAKFYYRAFIVSLVSFSSSWYFSIFYWISWSFWSNCFWANTSLAIFFPTLAYGLQILGDQFDAQHIFTCTILHPANVPSLRKVIELFSHRTMSHTSFS